MGAIRAIYVMKCVVFPKIVKYSKQKNLAMLPSIDSPYNTINLFRGSMPATCEIKAAPFSGHLKFRKLIEVVT